MICVCLKDQDTKAVTLISNTAVKYINRAIHNINREKELYLENDCVGVLNFSTGKGIIYCGPFCGPDIVKF